MRSWFKVDVDKLVSRWDVYAKYIRPLSSQVNGVAWLVTFVALGFLLLGRKRLRFNVIQRQILLLIIGYMAVYIGFSLIAHPILLRYLLPLYGPQLAVVYIVLIGLTSSKQASVLDRSLNK